MYRIGLDGKASRIPGRMRAKPTPWPSGPNGELYTVSETTGKVLCYDETGARRVVAEGIPGRYVLARPDGALYITGPARRRPPAAASGASRTARATVVD